ncbi:uncharacterized protein LOC111295334 [Durio zibethinus]|uniref:Uncharacterized protein LOC111295334 n=1 Tax=Durio zibethinus TaxID=66656 RepID=A0A6P5YVD5_DURZI|nr:uncharacterized protein LOC111295334 [Durio zibethinus]
MELLLNIKIGLCKSLRRVCKKAKKQTAEEAKQAHTAVQGELTKKLEDAEKKAERLKDSVHRILCAVILSFLRVMSTMICVKVKDISSGQLFEDCML